MSAINEKEGSGTPVELSQGSQNSHELSRKHSAQELEHIPTTEKHDAENALGDNSDGQIDWNIRQIITTISLAIVYVGSCQLHSEPLP